MIKFVVVILPALKRANASKMTSTVGREGGSCGRFRDGCGFLTIKQPDRTQQGAFKKSLLLTQKSLFDLFHKHNTGPCFGDRDTLSDGVLFVFILRCLVLAQPGFSLPLAAAAERSQSFEENSNFSGERH